MKKPKKKRNKNVDISKTKAASMAESTKGRSRVFEDNDKFIKAIDEDIKNEIDEYYDEKIRKSIENGLTRDT